MEKITEEHLEELKKTIQINKERMKKQTLDSSLHTFKNKGTLKLDDFELKGVVGYRIKEKNDLFSEVTLKLIVNN